MKTKELLELIGEPTRSMIIAGRYGNATLHRKGFWSCDPCYLPDELNAAISQAHVAFYPWEGRNYQQHHDEWMPFELEGQTLYARSCGDGVGYFGNCVDAGWVVVLPMALAPDFMKEQVVVVESQETKPEPVAA